MKRIQFLISLLVLSISASLSLAAWNPPTMSPPNANTDPPINQSSSSQVKAGGLGLGSLLVSGTSVFDGILSMLEQAASPSGEAGYGKIYWKTDHKLYKMDSSGVETEIGVGGGKIDDLDDGINASGDTTLALGTNAGISDDATDNRNTFVGIGAGKDTSTGISNSAFGYQALWENTTGQDNTAIGREALSSSTTASSNTAVGAHALSADTTGVDNTAVGTYALLSNHDGSHNAAFGMNALRMNDSGSYNTAIGKQAMESNTTGGANTATGFTAMFHNTTGQDNAAYGYASLHFSNGWSNAALGAYSLHENTSGDNNAAVGRGALYENKDGNRNIAVGYQSGSKIADGTTANTTGDNNIFIGADTKANADGDQNEIVIGDNATGHGSNTVTIGNNSVTATYLRGNIYKNGVLFGGGKFVDGNNTNDAVYTTGNVGIGTTDPHAKLEVSSTTNASPTSGSLVLSHPSNYQRSSIVFPSRVNYGSDYGYIEYRDDDNDSGESARLTIGTSNDGDDNIILSPSGRVGIGDNYPTEKLDVNGKIRARGGVHVTGDWYRIDGNNGIYWQSHGGGWHMTDGTWLRTYGNKSIYTGGGQINLGNGWLTHAYLNNQDCYTAHWSDDDGKCNNGYYLAGMDEHGDDIDSFECCRPG